MTLLVFAVSLAVYISTMAATASFWDAGEFVATSYILGIPHSPGTPLYVLVGRVFSMLPLPLSIAQRVNLLSAVCGALGVVVAYLVILRVLKFMFGEVESGLKLFIRHAGCVAGAMFLCFSSTYWTNATEAEVYALSNLLMGFCAYLALFWLSNPTGRVWNYERREILDSEEKKVSTRKVQELRDRKITHSRTIIYLIIYILSLGIGFHLGTILVYGGVFLLLLMVREKSFSNAELLIFTFGMAVLVADMTLHRNSSMTLIGLVILAILVVWTTLSRGKFALVTTALFVLGISVHLFLLIRSGLDPAIDEVDPETWRSLYAHLRREQYPAMKIFERKASFIFQLKHFWNYFMEQFRMIGNYMLGPFNLGKVTTAVIPLALGVYGIIENYNREKKTWTMNFTVLLLNSLGLILFLNFSDSEVRERDYFYSGAFYFFAIFIGVGAASFLRYILRSSRDWMGNFKTPVLAAGVLLIILSVLPGRYHWYTHDRSQNYIPADYAHNILAGLEPDAIIFTNGDNDTFPLWYIQQVEEFRTDVRVVNRMLLNTGWYLKQLRDKEPRVPLKYTDQEIDQLHPYRSEGKIWWISDIAIKDIINHTQWKRPVYFAVSVPTEVWDRYSDYLEMQGMVRKVVPRKGKNMVNECMIRRNYQKLFRFRGLFTGEGEERHRFYVGENARRMFGNFALGAFRLAVINARRENYQEAIRWTRRTMKYQPDFSWGRKYLGYYYFKNNQKAKAIKYYRSELEKSPQFGDLWMGLASIYEASGELDKALQVLKEAVRVQVDHRDLYGYGFSIAAKTKRRDEAVNFVREWLEMHPDDEEYQHLYNNVDMYMEERFGEEDSGKVLD